MNFMNVLVVDDHVLVREAIVGMLKSQPDFNVVGQAGSVKEAIVLVREYKPDVVLMDFILTDGDGPEATQTIISEFPDTKVVFLTAHDDDEYLMAAVRSGALGYLLKDWPLSKLVTSLRDLVQNDEAAFSPKMTTRILRNLSRMRSPSNPFQPKEKTLSLRELDILFELGKGATNHQIAEQLHLSQSSIKNYIHRILQKLELKNRQEAGLYARTMGLKRYQASYTTEASSQNKHPIVS
jgi:DNA-binding NarL/FixJ family response regulator